MLSELPGLLCLLAPAALGVAVCAAAKVGRDRCETLVAGTVLGVVGFATFTFLLTRIFALSPALIAAVLVAHGAAAIVVGARTAALAHWRAAAWGGTSVAVLIGALLITLPITHRLMTAEAGGISATLEDSWDLAWHSSVTRSFVVGQSTAPDYVLLGGIALKYPFITDFFTAILCRSGVSLPHAISGTAMVCFPIVYFTYFMLVRSLTTSRAVALLALVLFACNGATFGFTTLLDQPGYGLAPSDWPWLMAGKGYTALPFHFANLATHVLKHQRAYLLGLPLAFLGVTLVARGRSRAELAVAGVLVGLMPLVHAHNNIPVGLAVLALATTVDRHWWPWFAVPALALGVPEVAFYAVHSNVPAQLSIAFGWVADEQTGAFTLWFLNSGFILPLAVAALFLRPPPLLFRLAIVGLLLFVLANVFQFAVWKWDNYKLLLFWAAFVAPAVAWTICWCAARVQRSPYLAVRSVGLAAVVMLYGVHALSGALDLVHELLVAPPRRIVWSAADQAVAAELEATTPPRAIIAGSPSIFSAIGLAGRSWYVGEHHMVDSHGYNAIGEARLQAARLYMKMGRDTFPPGARPAYLLLRHADRTIFRVRDIGHLGPPLWTIGDTSLYPVRRGGTPPPALPLGRSLTPR